jgi:hypothetical protein
MVDHEPPILVKTIRAGQANTLPTAPQADGRYFYPVGGRAISGPLTPVTSDP